MTSGELKQKDQRAISSVDRRTRVFDSPSDLARLKTTHYRYVPACEPRKQQKLLPSFMNVRSSGGDVIRFYYSSVMRIEGKMRCFVGYQC